MGLKKYLMSYRYIPESLMYYRCEASGNDHAREQLLKADKRAYSITILEINGKLCHSIEKFSDLVLTRDLINKARTMR